MTRIVETKFSYILIEKIIIVLIFAQNKIIVVFGTPSAFVH